MSMYKLLAAQYDLSWLVEVNEPQLTKEFMQKHKLKGSPKVSKQLIKAGVPERVVSMAFSAHKESVRLWSWQGTHNVEVVRLQGNSTHYDSCQAVTNPEDTTSWKGSDNCKIEQDLGEYKTSKLFFLTVGELGDFKARVKVRAMLDHEDNQLVGLFIDRPYGQESILRDAIYKGGLLPKGLPLYGSSVYWAGTNCSFEDFYIPSFLRGYQDSFQRGMQMVQLNTQVDSQDSLLRQAYFYRKFEGGTYTTKLNASTYNATKCQVEHPAEELPFCLDRWLLKRCGKSILQRADIKALGFNKNAYVDLTLSDHTSCFIWGTDSGDLNNHPYLRASRKSNLMKITLSESCHVVMREPKFYSYDLPFIPSVEVKGECLKLGFAEAIDLSEKPMAIHLGDSDGDLM